ncbi:transglutaminase domain-containing protein [Microbacteriaceae bacterium VKM Ac-2855]|nr:transglutaminase domain-containing protein [Microbacteriaceae bacterium VKM Ac-2855]
MSAARVTSVPTRPARALALDALAMSALLVAGAVGFGRVFSGAEHLVASCVGVVVALVVALLGARFRLGVLMIAFLTVVGYLLAGTAAALRFEAVAGVFPGPAAVQHLVTAPVTGWKSLLTIRPPAGAFPELLLVPYLTVLICGVIGFSLAFRAARPLWALLPAAVVLGVSILFGTTEAVAPLGQAIAFGAVALGWSAWRRIQPTTSGGTGLRLRRLGSAVVVLLVAATAVVGTAAVADSSGARFALRERIVPPLDLHDYVTPLASYRKIVRDQKETTLFTVTGLAAGQRIRLATMDSYTGLVYDVASGGGTASGTFARIGESVQEERTGTPTELTLAIEGLSGVWLPDSGYLTGIRFDGDRQARLAASMHYNAATGVGVVTAGLAAGDSYTISAVLPPPPEEADLAGAAATAVTVPAARSVPEAVAAATTEAVGDTTGAYAQARAIETSLHTEGFFSHGLEGESPSRPGHGSGRLQSMLAAAAAGGEMIGDDEQYATLMALMAGSIGLPARVVMGFYPVEGTPLDGTVAVTGADLHAWVEIPFSDAGWVVFDPTPPVEQVPQQQSPEPQKQPQAQVLQPPPPPQEPAEVPPDVVAEDDPPGEGGNAFGWILVVLGALGWTVAGLAVLLGPAIAIAIVKAKRRTRRSATGRAADRVSGGWSEIRDHAADLGAVLPAGATRREEAETLQKAFPSAQVIEAARAADSAVFGPVEPEDDDAKAFWVDVDGIVTQMKGSVSRTVRWRAAVSLRSLRPEWVRAALDARRSTVGHRSAADQASGPGPASGKTPAGSSSVVTKKEAQSHE